MIKTNNKAVLYIICSIVCGAIVSGITNNNVFAEDVNYEVNIASGINIAIPSDTVTLSLNPFTAEFGSTNLPVTVTTNNSTGYTLTMSPSDDTTTSLTRTGGAETIPTLDDLSGGYTEQTFTTNKWGYKLATTNYLPFATSNEIAVTNAPTAASGNTSTVTFAAKGDTTLTAGAYNLEITFAAVANYAGPVVPDPPATCNTPVPGNYTYLQDINSSNKASVLASLTEGEAYFLRDSRDEEPYCVSKLVDGNLWFLDNLRLDLLANKDVLNSTNTNATDIELAYLKGTSVRDLNTDPDGRYATSGVADWEDLMLDSDEFNDGSYSDPLTAVSNTKCVQSDRCLELWTKDDVTVFYGNGSGKIGAYYNFCAASAGTYCYGSPDDSGSVSSIGATSDICPAGWRLPTGGASGEYQALAYEIFGHYDPEWNYYDGDNAIIYQNALSLTLADPYRDTAADVVGIGKFWSSTAYEELKWHAYILYVDDDGVSPQTYNDRTFGYLVRCLLK